MPEFSVTHQNHNVHGNDPGVILDVGNLRRNVCDVLNLDLDILVGLVQCGFDVKHGVLAPAAWGRDSRALCESNVAAALSGTVGG